MTTTAVLTWTLVALLGGLVLRDRVRAWMERLSAAIMIGVGVRLASVGQHPGSL